MTDLTKNFSSLLESAKGLSQVIRQSAPTSGSFDPNSLKEILNANSLSTFNTSFLDPGIDQKPLSAEEIIHKLNSSREGSKLIALKYIVKLMSTDSVRDDELLIYFPHVLKGISSPNLTIKKLVFIFLLRYNHRQPDIALLSINAIQKSLTDRDPVIRSLAIRVLGGIQIKAIVPILVLSLKKTIVDASALVRASSAIAIRKCSVLENSIPYLEEYDERWKTDKADDHSITSQLYTSLSKLLADSDPKVIGAALIAFHELFPHGYELLHKVFKHICSELNSLEPTAQALAIQLLTVYCRKFLSKPQLLSNENVQIPLDCYPRRCSNVEASCEIQFAPDLFLFLEAQKNLIYSSDSNVHFSVAKSFLSLSCPTIIKKYKINVMLLNMLSLAEPSGLKHYVLQVILLFTMYEPSLFTCHIRDFFVLPSDDSQTVHLKVAILIQLLHVDNFATIFHELKYYLHDSSYVEDKSKTEILKLVNEVYFNPFLTQIQMTTVLDWYLSKLGQFMPPSLLTEYFNGIRIFIQEDLISNERILGILATKLIEGKVEGPTKGSIIWLLGEFANLSDLDFKTCFIVDILRILLQNLPCENPEVKLNVLYLAAKLMAKEVYTVKRCHKNDSHFNFHSPLFKIFNLILNYCKYDKSVDIRDRARFISSLLPNVVINEGNSINIVNLEQLIETQIVSLNQKLSKIEIGVLVFQVFKDPPQIGARVCEKLVSNLVTDYFKVDEWNTLSANELAQFSEKRHFDLEIRDYSRNTSWLSSEQNNGNLDESVLSSQNSLIASSNQTRYTHEHGIPPKSLKIKTLDEFFNSDNADEYGTSQYNEDSEDSEDSEDEEDEEEDDSEDVDDDDSEDVDDDDSEDNENDDDEDDEDSPKDQEVRQTNDDETGHDRGKWT